jgi:hypothetical protein
MGSGQLDFKDLFNEGAVLFFCSVLQYRRVNGSISGRKSEFQVIEIHIELTLLLGPLADPLLCVDPSQHLWNHAVFCKASMNLSR